MNTFQIWKSIISNPFKGYEKVGKQTRILLPLLVILILVTVNLLILTPIMQSSAYTSALVKVQMIKMNEKGMGSSVSREDLEKQLSAPLTKRITLISSFAGGIITYTAVLFLSAFLIWLLSLLLKDKKNYKIILKILIFAGLVSTLQGIVKSTIVATGDWERILHQVRTIEDFSLALQAPTSFAALINPAKSGMPLYILIDSVTDIFNWIYYIFIFAGLSSALKMEKQIALKITVLYAVLSIAVGIAATFLF